MKNARTRAKWGKLGKDEEGEGQHEDKGNGKSGKDKGEGLRQERKGEARDGRRQGERRDARGK